MKTKQIVFLVLTISLLTKVLTAQTVFTGNGNWSDAAKWSKGVPFTGVAAVISSGSNCTVDVNANCGSLSISATSRATSVTINPTVMLVVDAGVTINAPSSNNVTGLLNVSDGVLTCSSLSMGSPSSGTKRVCELRINDGTANITGAAGINMAGNTTENLITFTGSGVINNAGTLGNGGTINPGTGTINFNGTGSQVIRGYGFYNLTSSSSGPRILQSSVTIGVAGTFTPGPNAYTVTGSTVNFNGTGSQTIPGFQFNNLIISGARKANTITLASGDTIFVQGDFTNNATFTSGSYISASNVFAFNGGVQAIGGITYDNLITAGSGTFRQKTLSGSVNVNSSFIVGSGDTVNLSAQNVTVYGNTVINGTLTDNNTGGINTMYGQVTVNGVWNITSAESFTFTGGLTNNGYFSSSTGVYTFASKNQVVDGTSPISLNGSIAINNGIRLTNNTRINVTGSITGSTGCVLINNTEATLSVGGILLSTGTLDASAVNNTVIYNNASAQTILSGTYYHLTKQNSGALNVASTVTVNGNFSIN